MSAPSAPARTTAKSLASRYRGVRATTERLAAPLSPEDCGVQSMPDASPTRWHLAHVSWFFETFVLKRLDPEHRPFDPAFEHLFNSYYNTVGRPFPRPRRGVITRPGLESVRAYRRWVDERMVEVLGRHGLSPELLGVVEIGLNHEQQHQELILMDIKHALSANPLFPAYREDLARPTGNAAPLTWLSMAGGMSEIGHAGAGFAYDNESPRHAVYLAPSLLASRLVTNAEYLEFIEDGGYERHDLWLDEGWSKVRTEHWQAPLYWVRRDEAWSEFTLGGLRALDLDAPVSHVSYYEATAFAQWAAARLPTEAEWEALATGRVVDGNFVESDLLHPQAPPATGDGATQLYGDLWEWTSSSYAPYPGYRPPAGAIGEYNGKFMCSQYVMRGGACVTSRSHVRATYRNFFYPWMRWQFGGIRLARDGST